MPINNMFVFVFDEFMSCSKTVESTNSQKTLKSVFFSSVFKFKTATPTSNIRLSVWDEQISLLSVSILDKRI